MVTMIRVDPLDGEEIIVLKAAIHVVDEESAKREAHRRFGSRVYCGS
jgi:hypothetical protein